MRPAVCLDLETAPLPDASAWLDPVEPAKHLRDPDKIAADLARRQAERLERLALDPYTCRIVAIGWATESGATTVGLAPTLEDEVLLIRRVAEEIIAPARRLIGYHLLRFDLPVLVARSRLLAVASSIYERIDLRRYGNTTVVDLYDRLTCGGQEPTPVLSRSLASMARRFGCPITAIGDGADIPRLVEAEAWDDVRAHCHADVQQTWWLAERLGLLRVSGDRA